MKSGRVERPASGRIERPAARARSNRSSKSPVRSDADGSPAPSSKARLILYFDGASRGNPGPASFGVYSPAGIERSEAIGRTTNNVAEWRGFLAALEEAIAAGATDVEIRADSELVLKQFLGTYRMKAPHLAPFLVEARARARRIPRLSVVHVPRAQNHRADALANAALDGKTPSEKPEPAPAAAKQASLFPS